VTAEASTSPAARALAEDRIGVASQWTLAWRKFRRHKLALASAVFIGFVYLVALLAEVIAPNLPDAYDGRFAMAPPQQLHILSRDENGNWQVGLTVHGYRSTRDPRTLRRQFTVDEASVIPVGFFVRGPAYDLWGVIPMERHLIGPLQPGEPFYLLGSDRLGRDLLSRIVYGTRVSMSIGLVGVAISLVLGVLLGGISGYYGGAIDTAIQRVIEFIMSVPTIPLWMGLAAAIPPNWSPLLVYLIITVIISLIGWTTLAREVRGRFISWRNEPFVIAARLDGTREMAIIVRHLVPGFLSHIIASVTLAIPAMIIAETALSFLGIGLRPPVVSWGVLLQEAQNIRTLSEAPWLLLPAAAVILTVIALNFLGDGLRDSADPYSA
jgi:peptide/nickel transport system permease protein